MLGPRSLILTSPGSDEVVSVGAEQFDLLQSLICQVGGEELLSGEETTYNPANAQAAKIAEKMRKAAERKRKMRKAEPTAEGFLAKYFRAAVTVGHSVEEVNSMTLLQLTEFMQSHYHKESFEIEVKSRLALGAKNNGDKLIHWTDRKTVDNSIGVI